MQKLINQNQFECCLHYISDPKLQKCLCNDSNGESECLEGVNATEKVDGRTALHLAARFDQSSCIEPLVQAGADIEAKDNDDSTPMKLASWKANCASIEQLKSLNASTENLDDEHYKNILQCYSGISFNR